MSTEERILALQEESTAIVEKIKSAKQQQGKTVQQLVDETGIPKTTLNRFFAGTLMNPGFMDVRALCIALDLSPDAMAGIDPQPSDDAAAMDMLQMEIDHKDEMLREKDNAISRLLDRSRMQEAGISTRDARIQRQSEDIRRKDKALVAARSSDRPLMFTQCALNILMAIFLMVYMVLDARNPDIGLIRPDRVSVLILLAFFGIIAAAVTCVILIVRPRRGKKEAANEQT